MSNSSVFAMSQLLNYLSKELSLSTRVSKCNGWKLPDQLSGFLQRPRLFRVKFHGYAYISVMRKFEAHESKVIFNADVAVMVRSEVPVLEPH